MQLYIWAGFSSPMQAFLVCVGHSMGTDYCPLVMPRPDTPILANGIGEGGEGGLKSVIKSKTNFTSGIFFVSRVPKHCKCSLLVSNKRVNYD